MASQIVFFRKNRADYENPAVEVIASEGEGERNIINRDNRSAFVTTESDDSANTTIELDFKDVHRITDILLLKHNFKSFEIQYFDDVAEDWAHFSPAIDETDCDKPSSHFEVSPVLSSRVRLIVRGTRVPDAQKVLFQFIVTELIGQLQSWPLIKNPMVGREVAATKMLSGRHQLTEALGGWSARLSVENLSDADDLRIIEDLHDSNEGFLVWPCGGDEDQFSSRRQGYRIEDIYLVRCASRLSPEWYQGMYQSGMRIELDLVEVNT